MGLFQTSLVELIPQAKHSTHPPPCPLSTLAEADPIIWEPYYVRTLGKFLGIRTIIITPKGGRKKATLIQEKKPLGVFCINLHPTCLSTVGKGCSPLVGSPLLTRHTLHMQPPASCAGLHHHGPSCSSWDTLTPYSASPISINLSSNLIPSGDPP